MSGQHDGYARLLSRAYQLEMFDQSMKTNTIVVMGTGTGKTHVASLRIDAELRRTPNKQIWFTAPNAGLVDQQLRFLATQMPEYRMKSLTGRDNVDMWGDANIWIRVLTDVNVVVATPQVLLDALHNGHVHLENISLLVFDEAHHCQANNPSALIMQTFYHPLKARSSLNLPHVLGLTASPCISDKSASLRQLEANLDAICRSPTLSVQEYAKNVHKAMFVKRSFTYVERQPSVLLQKLEQLVTVIDYREDPYYMSLLNAGDDIQVQQKLNKIERRGATPAVTELNKFFGNACYLHESLGSWASDLYIKNRVTEWRKSDPAVNSYHDSRATQHHKFIDGHLSGLHVMITESTRTPEEAEISVKALKLIEFLMSEYHEGIAVMIFVNRRCAAWALCQLLMTNALLQCYGVFSYVGSSIAKPKSLHECSDIKTQGEAFSGFRAGSRNLCIATSVAEEGIDVQAVNVVIRYDDPNQVASYLQSRGRARQRESKFVCFQETDADPAKYADWDKFEKAMEELCRNDERTHLAQIEADNCEEESDEVYRIDGSNARLDLNVSVSRLAHFCAKSPLHADPIYILDGEIGEAVSAKVRLPSSVPPQLREAQTCRSWRSEKMARRDAAFHAVKALHLAGLINDHLAPFEEEKNTVPLLHEKKLREVPAEHQVWADKIDGLPSFAYRIEASHHRERYLSLIMILSTPLHRRFCFPLNETARRKIDITIVPLGEVDSYATEVAERTTELLFKAAFREGSASDSLRDLSRLSCLVLPEFEDSQLGTSSVSLSEFMKSHEWLLGLQPLLVWKASRLRPYIWYPPHIIQQDEDGGYSIAAKQIRKLQIFSKALNNGVNAANLPQPKALLLTKCETRGVATIYGPMLLLLPSILHIMEAAIRAQHANETVLKSIRFSSTEFIVPALLAKSASGTYNYERLEFLGDACLKYFTSVQMFFEHPSVPEGILTRRTHEIIGNTRLERAVDDVGLASFITTEMPVQRHWKLPKIKTDSEILVKRSILSKTLADVVESVLGAAFLDGLPDGRSTQQCLATLQLFIPEVKWLAPEVHVRSSYDLAAPWMEKSLLQYPVKQMLGYNFQNSALLVEALTHSTDEVSQPALDRLEFLGDAILDQIIKVMLFEYPDLDAGRLTVCRHALASHVYLAYCALGVHYDRVSSDVIVDQRGQVRPIVQTQKVELTDLVKFRDAALRGPIVMAKARYDEVRDAIESELKSGRFPWTLLRSINAPKVSSDIIESLLAAIFLDTKGSLESCQKMLERLGLMDLLQRMAQNMGFEVRTPGTVLRELCAEKKITVSIESRCENPTEASRYIGKVCLDGNVNITRKASGLEEAKSLAAEAALEFLLTLQG